MRGGWDEGRRPQTESRHPRPSQLLPNDPYGAKGWCGWRCALGSPASGGGWSPNATWRLSRPRDPWGRRTAGGRGCPALVHKERWRRPALFPPGVAQMALLCSCSEQRGRRCPHLPTQRRPLSQAQLGLSQCPSVSKCYRVSSSCRLSSERLDAPFKQRNGSGSFRICRVHRGEKSGMSWGGGGKAGPGDTHLVHQGCGTRPGG